MKNAFGKDVARSVRKSIGRFVAIAVIAALGTGFYAGLRMVGSDMKLAADEFFDATNMSDINVLSSLGVDDQMLQDIASLEGVLAARPYHEYDASCTIADMPYSVRIRGIDMNTAASSDTSDGIHAYSGDQSYLDRPILMEGQWPQATDECVLGCDAVFESPVQVGDTVVINRLSSDSAVEDTFDVTCYKVTGFVRSSSYICATNMGSTSLGDGMIDEYMFVSDECFADDLPYTGVAITIQGASELVSGSDEYQQKVDSLIGRIEAAKETIAQGRLGRIKAEAQEEIDKGWDEYTQSKDEADDKLNEAQEELESGREQLEQAQSELEDGRRELLQAADELSQGYEELEDAADKLTSTRAQLDDAKVQLADAKAQLDDAKAQLDDAKAQIDEGEAQLQQAQQEYDAGAAQLQQLIQVSNEVMPAASALTEQLTSQLATISQSMEYAASSEEGAMQLIQQATESLQGASASLQSLRQNVQAYAPDSQLTALLQQQEDSLNSMIEAIEAVGSSPASPQQKVQQVGQIISQGQQELSGAQQQFGQASASIEQQIAGAQAELDAAKQQIDDGQAQLDQARSEYDAGLAEYQQGLAEYEKNYAEYLDGEKAYEQGLATYEASVATYEQGIDEYDSGLQEYDQGLQDYWEGLAEYQDGQAEYDQSKADAQQELADAEAELKDAQDELDSIESPELFVLDRTKNLGAASYSSDSDRIDKIASVFPFIFFLVAALVCLTTMTRMVDEERVLIGTYKALGYSTGKIISKYLVYALMACVIGCVVGVALLTQVLPKLIMAAYAIMYKLPTTPTPIDPVIAAVAIALSLAITLGATWFAGWATLRENPAALMLPRAPKAGKRIILEHIPVLWRNLSFSWKVTARNIFRYKRRFVMAIIGIAGCTALLLTGFGLHDSINDILSKQYDSQTPLFNYNMTIGMDPDATQQQRDEMTRVLESSGISQARTSINRQNMLARHATSGEDLRVLLVIPEDTQGFEQFITFKDRLSGQVMHLQDGGVLVSEKLASETGVGVGDQIVLYEQDQVGNATGSGISMRVGGVVENYVSNYVYMTPADYQQTTGELPVFDIDMLQLKGADSEVRKLSEQLMALDGVSTVAETSEVIAYYREALGSVNMVVWVLIVSAAVLAFVVLYNLTNINISERSREIATLKVLGFTPREVDAYVFREIIILSIIGALVGLVLGIFLEMFVITTAEVDQVMFGREIHAMSYVYSIVLTMVFTVIVSVVMRRKLKSISMVESLKSVE